jgi:hypothetical protein
MGLSYQEKIYTVANTIDDMFKMAPKGAVIDFWHNGWIDIPYKEVELIVNKMAIDYKMISFIQEWKFVSTASYCKIKKLEGFNDGFSNIIKEFRKYNNIEVKNNSSKVANLRTYNIEYKQGTIYIFDGKIRFKFKKLRQGTQKDVWEFIYKNSLKTFTKSEIMKNTGIKLKSGSEQDRLDIMMNNIFANAKDLKKLIFTELGSDKICFKNSFTEEDIQKLDIKSLEI